MLTYYPSIAPYADYQLPVDAPHVLYVEECGNPNGLPILVVHGGPGGGCNEDSRRYFDPNIYRIILFDQRGAGRSTPHAELYDNNTQALVRDMEAIRKFLKIEQWILFGGSWGSTLSLVYAQTYPTAVLGLILRGIFLGREHDIRWLYYDNGVNRIYPDYWEEFSAPVPLEKRPELVHYYYQLLTGDNEIARFSAAKTWSTWEARLAKLEPDKRWEEQLTNPHTALSFARLECHYFINHCFLKPNQILNHMEQIKHLPAIIVHGRYDMVCLVENAWDLYRAWPNSELNIIRLAGHSSSDAGILDALIRATQKMPQLLQTLV